MESSAPCYANQADIIRANMRDSQCVDYLQATTLEVEHALLPSGWVDSHRDVTRLLVAGFYHVLCASPTGSTIGEEDTGVVLSLPNTQQRLWYRLARFGVSYLLPAAAGKLFERMVPLLHRLNISVDKLRALASRYLLCRFLFAGKYFSYADWVLGFRYLVTVPQGYQAGPVQYSYAGKVIALQILVELGMMAVEAWKGWSRRESTENDKDKDGVQAESEDVGKMCAICMERWKGPSAAKCGHVFCWDCIINYVQRKPQCPVCRKDTRPQDVILLYNVS